MEVEEEFAEQYDFEEPYSVQEPYQDVEMQTVMVKQQEQCLEKASNQYTWWVQGTVRGILKEGCRSGEQTWVQVVSAFHCLDTWVAADLDFVGRRFSRSLGLQGYPSDFDKITFVVHDGTKIIFESAYSRRDERWNRDIPKRGVGSFQTKTVEKEVAKQVQVAVTKYRRTTQHRIVTRSRTAKRTAFKTIENKRPIEDFHQQALQQVIEEIRCTFGSAHREVSMNIDPEDSVSQVALKAAAISDQSADSDPEHASSWALVDAADRPTLTGPASWVSDNSGPHCFVPGTLFKTTAGPHQDFFLQCQDLVPGSRIVAADDATILEVTKIEMREADHIVMLKAGDAVLRVTPCHRVVALADDSDNVTEDVCAGKLLKGRRILGSGGVPMELTEVQTVSEQIKVFEIAFHPDMPVKAFEPPAAILTKGQAFKKNSIRRGGMNRRGKAGGGGYECNQSIPNTAPGEYAD